VPGVVVGAVAVGLIFAAVGVSYRRHQEVTTKAVASSSSSETEETETGETETIKILSSTNAEGETQSQVS
jgi:hypothetical protein